MFYTLFKCIELFEFILPIFFRMNSDSDIVLHMCRLRLTTAKNAIAEYSIQFLLLLTLSCLFSPVFSKSTVSSSRGSSSSRSSSSRSSYSSHSSSSGSSYSWGGSFLDTGGSSISDGLYRLFITILIGIAWLIISYVIFTCFAAICCPDQLGCTDDPEDQQQDDFVYGQPMTAFNSPAQWPKTTRYECEGHSLPMYKQYPQIVPVYHHQNVTVKCANAEDESLNRKIQML